MIKEIDCCGMSCPAPVLSVRDALEKEALDAIAVLVDNEAALQNVSRFLEHRNYLVKSARHGNLFRVIGAQGESTAELQDALPSVAATEHQAGAKKIMVLVTSVHMGHGDDALGDMLMFNFLKTLKEMGPELWRVVFVNSGVSFTAEGSEAVPVLQELAVAGVRISACGACLVFFHVLDKIQVGEVTNMLEIITAMKEADSVITI